MILSLAPRDAPTDAIFRHPVTTPAERLAALTALAPAILDRPRSIGAMTHLLGCDEAEARDTAQALADAAVWVCTSRGWQLRLRSEDERRLVAANDNVRPGAVRVLQANAIETGGGDKKSVTEKIPEPTMGGRQ